MRRSEDAAAGRQMTSSWVAPAQAPSWQVFCFPARKSTPARASARAHLSCHHPPPTRAAPFASAKSVPCHGLIPALAPFHRPISPSVNRTRRVASNNTGIMAAKARPYRGFMSPFLHRQFGYVMGLTLAICYAYALWQGQFNSCASPFEQPQKAQLITCFTGIWVWFFAGIRALFLFIGFLFTLCLTMAHTHCESRPIV